MNMSELLYRGRTGTRNLRRKADLEGPGDGSTTVEDGREEYTYDVLLDWDKLCEFTMRAARSKSGQCKVGPLTVKVTSRKKV